ncbi:succinyl-diaminopimelate desuccinylase [Pelagibacterales bacterium]|nr:succinyl-diaminopimelate desuccinylase [Pelagibacterales bacterium]
MSASSIDPVKLTQSLISCPSVTPTDAGVLQTLQDQLEEIGFRCTRMPFEETGTEAVDNLFASYGEGAPHLCFGGHTDVVPVGNSASWTNDPFDAVIKDGNLYGRGTADMKSAIAAFTAAASNFIKTGDFKGTISLLITNDEEGPAINGTQKVLEAITKNGEKIDSCIVGEPTCPAQLGEMIKIGRRGSLTTNITITGIQGHVAYPQWTLNPIDALTKVLSKIVDLNLDEGTDDFPPSNIEIVKIDADNTADNVVPQSATAQINIRYNILQTEDGLMKLLQEMTDQELTGTKYTSNIEFRNSAQPFLTKESDFTKKIKEAVDLVTGLDSEFSTTGGTSDARFFKDYCEVAEFGLVGSTAHQVDEHVAVKDIENLAKIYEEIIKKYFN